MSDVPTPKKPKHRSPNYPAVGLEKAVELLAKLNVKFGHHPVPIGLVHALWDYKAGSGVGNQAVAALKSYGLVDVDGEGDNRRITVSKDGRRVVGNAPDRAAILRRAAQLPKIHQEILEHYGDRGLPDDALLQQYLVWDRPEGQRFNPDSVSEFIERFRATLTYAGVTVGDKIVNGDRGDEEDKLIDDPPPEDEKRTPPSKLRRKMLPVGSKEDVFTLSSGDAVLQWPEHITPDEYEDLEGWLQLMLRKLKRSIVASSAKDDESGAD